MPKFKIDAPNICITLPNGEMWRSGRLQFLETDDPVLVDALRHAHHVDEVNVLPPEDARVFVESSAGGVYPLPDFSLRPVVVVGRGLSSKEFWKRYPLDKYWIVGVNPGSFPSVTKWRDPDPTDGMHCGDFDKFHVVASVDSHYPDRCSGFLGHFYGPVMCAAGMSDAYQGGPGQKHYLGHIVKGKWTGLSWNFALRAVLQLGAKEVIMCGVDCENYSGDIADMVAKVIRLRADFPDAVLWRDPYAKLVEIGDAYPNVQ